MIFLKIRNEKSEIQNKLDHIEKSPSGNKMENISNHNKKNHEKIQKNITIAKKINKSKKFKK